jgi:hypothetical protein
MSTELAPPETRLVAIFASDGAALDGAGRAGVRLLRMAGPGVALLAAGTADVARLYAAGARLVID